MTQWSAGYRADIGYLFGYYPELNPLRVNVAFLNAGLACPDWSTSCELGYGQGMSVNLHAAASPVQWYGTDFNPSQAAFAKETAAAAGSKAQLFDESFAEFAARPDLPGFDFIGVHGIWSWISDENRQVMVDFIRRKLNVGGVLYISYNTLPGFAAFAPVRHLMAEHARVIGSPGRGIVPCVDDAISFANRLIDVDPLFSRANPVVKGRLKKLGDQNRRYLAHEYFNQEWEPMYLSTMAQWLEPAKLQYACSAQYLDHVDGINLTPEQQAFLKEIPDPMFREGVRDFMVNQQFRRDFWVKGARRLNPLEQGEALRQQKMVLTGHRPDISLKVKGVLGEATMSDEVYTPLLDLMADHLPRTLGHMEQHLKQAGITFAQMVQAVMVLTGAGHMSPAQDDPAAAEAGSPTDRLNRFLLNRARGSGDIAHLASPVTGGGVSVGRVEQLFLLASNGGKQQPGEWAQFAWEILKSQGQKLKKDGQVLETDEQNLAHLTGQAEIFAQKQMPVLKALKVTS
jgi:hypothetical protein